MRLLIDMNLSPEWVLVFKDAGLEAEHWSQVGDFNAPDAEIMAHARSGQWTVFTHDLDFGAYTGFHGCGRPKREPTSMRGYPA